MSRNNPYKDMKKLIFTFAAIFSVLAVNAKTLIVYYSYTNNVERIVTELKRQIDADVVEMEPVEKGLDYAANNYAIGSAQISAIRNNLDDPASYPAIAPVYVNIDEYDTIIIGAPLWWSNMAAPMQTFLFQNGSKMAGKNIGLIVSSASSGISGVESDAKRLIPNGKFLSPSLWIRSSQTSNARTLISDWLNAIGYDSLSGIEAVTDDLFSDEYMAVYNLSGQRITDNRNLSKGVYIVRYAKGNLSQTKKIFL